MLSALALTPRGILSSSLLICDTPYAGVPLPSNWRVDTKTRPDGSVDKVPTASY